MTEQMNENGVSTAGKRTQAQLRRFLVERNMSEQTIKAYSYAVKQFYGLYPQLTDKNLQLYKVFLGTKPDDPTFVEFFYSVGLALGIFLFFNHVPGKKVTNEPTPIQVQMRLYEQDVNRTFLLGASRKGEELDVSGNNDSANNK